MFAEKNIFQKQNFSILPDESTNIAMSQVVAVVVRYLDKKNQDVDAFLDTVVVESGTAKTFTVQSRIC